MVMDASMNVFATEVDEEAYVFESLDYFQHAEDKLFDSSVNVNIADYLE